MRRDEIRGVTERGIAAQRCYATSTSVRANRESVSGLITDPVGRELGTISHVRPADIPGKQSVLKEFRQLDCLAILVGPLVAWQTDYVFAKMRPGGA